MLFVLTGDIQTGKTRWLEHLVETLSEHGVSSQGVIAPGVWRKGTDPGAILENVDANGFEKLGIDNVLLPQGDRITFARRRDIAQEEGLIDPNAQSEKADLHWYIDDGAIDRVNEHLAALPYDGLPASALLVIDELGRLELLRGVGLTEAMRLLEDGPTVAFPHALVIVRSALIDEVRSRFPRWGDAVMIVPDSASEAKVLDAFGC